MEREIYATDGVITLCPLAEEDKENYLILRRQVTDLSSLLIKNDEIAWKSIYEYTTGNYSVFDNNGEYCGNACFHNPDAKTPEIGVELLECKRNMGIGPRTVKLLAQTYYAGKPVEYFTFKVHSKNFHSRHVVENLGGVYERIDGNDFKERLERIENNRGKPFSDDFKKIFLESDEKEEILVYKYYPDAFLDKQ